MGTAPRPWSPASPLSMIVGLEDITSGEMLIDGNRVNEKRPRDRNLAMKDHFSSLTFEQKLPANLSMQVQAYYDNMASAR